MPIENKPLTDKQQRKEAERLVGVLQASEEALEALDQCGGSFSDVERTALQCYKLMKIARDNFVEEWCSDPDEIYKPHRCTTAKKSEYYTSSDGACEVWTLNDSGVCDTCEDAQ